MCTFSGHVSSTCCACCPWSPQQRVSVRRGSRGLNPVVPIRTGRSPGRERRPGASQTVHCLPACLPFCS